MISIQSIKDTWVTIFSDYFFLNNFFSLIFCNIFSDFSQIVRFLKILTFQGQVSRGLD